MGSIQVDSHLRFLLNHHQACEDSRNHHHHQNIGLVRDRSGGLMRDRSEGLMRFFDKATAEYRHNCVEESHQLRNP
ncbi:hypothetical protein C5167_043186 [Papaver somniferum]|uniref:Uncharacterized protein n=1 Tax=Papaver somniferum TaxID=3469 RepID=A0A4Y7L4Y3_PAPSO|nr:hypothetical protein C5167_043186 [Papaver somniferum]